MNQQTTQNQKLSPSNQQLENQQISQNQQPAGVYQKQAGCVNVAQRQQQLALAQQLRQQLEQEIHLQQKKQLQSNHVPLQLYPYDRQLFLPGQVHPVPIQQNTPGDQQSMPGQSFQFATQQAILNHQQAKQQELPDLELHQQSQLRYQQLLHHEQQIKQNLSQQSRDMLHSHPIHHELQTKQHQQIQYSQQNPYQGQQRHHQQITDIQLQHQHYQQQLQHQSHQRQFHQQYHQQVSHPPEQPALHQHAQLNQITQQLKHDQQRLQDLQYCHQLQSSQRNARTSPSSIYPQGVGSTSSFTSQNAELFRGNEGQDRFASQPSHVQSKFQSFSQQEVSGNDPRNFLIQQNNQLEHHHHHHQHHHQLQLTSNQLRMKPEQLEPQNSRHEEPQKKNVSTIMHQRAHTLHHYHPENPIQTTQSNQYFSTLPISMTRPIPAPRPQGGRRAPMRRQNSFSGFPSSSVGASLSYDNPSSNPTIPCVTIPVATSTCRNRTALHNPGDSPNTNVQLIMSSNTVPPVGSNVIITSSEQDSHPSTSIDSHSNNLAEAYHPQPSKYLYTLTTSDPNTKLNNTTVCSNINNNANNNESNLSVKTQPHGILNVRNDLCSSRASTTNGNTTSNHTEMATTTAAANNQASTIKDSRVITSSPTTTTSSTSSIVPMTSGSSEICSSQTGPNPNDPITVEKTSMTTGTTTSPTPLYVSSASKKRELRTGLGIFYSLPRHATVSSNPSLMRASASGLGLYFMSRRETATTAKESAAKQLGVSIPTGSNKFRSLPRPSCKYQSNTVKAQGYQSLPRPSRVLSTITMLSLPPSEIIAENLSNNVPSNELKRTNKDMRETAEGKENIDIKLLKKKENDHKPLYKDLDMKYQSLQRRREIDLKHLSLPKKIPKELKDIDAKYQSLPKKKFKDSELKYQSLPKRNGREIEGRHSSSSRRGKDLDGRHNSSKRSSSRESDGKLNKKDNRSPPGYNKVPSKRSEHPRSPRWIPTDSEEDEMYSSIKSRDDSSNQSSIPETPYSRPLPPLPVPSRYRRRISEKDGSSPPLPPPRSTGTLGSQNMQYNNQYQPQLLSDGPASYPPLDDMTRIIPGEFISSVDASTSNNLSDHTKMDFSNDAGYRPPPPRIPPPRKQSPPKSCDVYLGKNSMLPTRETPQGSIYPGASSSDQLHRVPIRSTSHDKSTNYSHPGSALTLPYPGSHGNSHSSNRTNQIKQNIIDQLPPGATYPRNHSTRLMYPEFSGTHLLNQQTHTVERSYPPATIPTSTPYKFHYLDMVQHGVTSVPGKGFVSGLPPTAIPLPGLTEGFTPGGFASSRAMFTGIPRDSVTGIPPPLDPPPKIPYSDTSMASFPVTTRDEESPLYTSDPLYEVPQIPPHNTDIAAFPIRPNTQFIRDQQQGLPIINNRQYNDSRTPSPDNLLVRTDPSGEEDHYSSIPSFVSTTPETPSTLPKGSWPNRVANSASWDSIGSSGFSSMGSSQGFSGNTSSSRESAAARRRRRARSDPRMDAGVLNRLAFSVCNSGINFEKEVRNTCQGSLIFNYSHIKTIYHNVLYNNCKKENSKFMCFLLMLEVLCLIPGRNALICGVRLHCTRSTQKVLTCKRRRVSDSIVRL